MFKFVTALLNSSRVPRSLVVLGSMLFFCAIAAQAGQITLTWDTDTELDQGGYRIYYGQTSGSYPNSVDVGNQTSYTLNGLEPGKTYYFAVKSYTYDSTGTLNESDFSDEIHQTIDSTSSACPCSIWTADTAPRVEADPNTTPIELGVKFKADIDGFVTGIRFYKDSSNTGIHTGTLWTNDGTQLATATFADEQASGWQQVNFAKPVPITTDTVYVASYHTNTGRHNADEYYFSSKDVDNPPLHALEDGGVYAYGASSRFPDQSYRSSNYWVDVIFTTP